MVSGKEGTVSTASRNCRNHVQRLRGWGNYAPQSSGSFNLDPWILRSMRLRWLNNLSGKHQTPCDLGLCKNEVEAQIAAFQSWASGQTTLSFSTTRICRLEARTGTSPPLSFHHPPFVIAANFPPTRHSGARRNLAELYPERDSGVRRNGRCGVLV